jgi:hypothetical protein
MTTKASRSQFARLDSEAHDLTLEIRDTFNNLEASSPAVEYLAEFALWLQDRTDGDVAVTDIQSATRYAAEYLWPDEDG